MLSWLNGVGQAEQGVSWREGAGGDELSMFLGGRKMKSGGVAGAGEVSMPQRPAAVCKKGRVRRTQGMQGEKGLTS